MPLDHKTFDLVESYDFDTTLSAAREQAEKIDRYLTRKYHDAEGKVNQVYFGFLIYRVIAAEGSRPNQMYFNFFNATTGYILDETTFYNLIMGIEDEGHFEDYDEDMFNDDDFCSDATLYMACCAHIISNAISYGVRSMINAYIDMDRVALGSAGPVDDRRYGPGSDTQAPGAGLVDGGSLGLGIVLGLFLSWIGIIIGAVLKKKKTLFGTLIGFGLQIVLAIVVYLVILPMIKK